MGPDPSSLAATCPKCGFQLWDYRGGQWTLMQRVVKLVDGVFHAKCGCGTEIPVPWLALRDPPPDPPKPAPSGRRFIVRPSKLRIDSTRDP